MSFHQREDEPNHHQFLPRRITEVRPIRLFRHGATFLLLTSLLFFITTPPGALGQDFYDDLADMDLAELTTLRFSQTMIPQLHHTHPKGEWMFGYSRMVMDMDGSRDGSSRVSDSEVLQDFPVTPTYMRMEMDMFMLMYGMTEDLTLMAMLPHHDKVMRHVTRTGRTFWTESSGWGDLKLTALYTFWRKDRHQMHLDAGFTLPTGSINKRDATPMGPDQPLPYPMQLGSGTFDLAPGLTYLGQNDEWTWGAHVDGVFRTSENNKDYTLGDQYHATAWASKIFNDCLSSYLRLDGTVTRNIKGANDALNPNVVPTADPTRRGGKRIDLSWGMSLFFPEGKMEGHRFSFEFGKPVYEYLEGPQLENDWHWIIGWEKTF